MTHKVTIELTDEQEAVTHHYDGNGNFKLTPQQFLSIKSQLPKPQKRWRFYKGKFAPDGHELNEVMQLKGSAFVQGEGYYVGDPDAFCFTREQFIGGLGPFLIRNLGRINMGSLGLVLSEYLSQQEEK